MSADILPNDNNGHHSYGAIELVDDDTTTSTTKNNGSFFRRAESLGTRVASVELKVLLVFVGLALAVGGWLAYKTVTYHEDLND